MAEVEVRSVLMPLEPKYYCLTPISDLSLKFYTTLYFLCPIFLKDIRTEPQLYQNLRSRSNRRFATSFYYVTQRKIEKSYVQTCYARYAKLHSNSALPVII